jgi:Flp pilus assembly protein TadG
MSRLRFVTSEEGAALIEFACVLPVFVLLLVGVVDYSLQIQQRMHVTEAAAIAAAYGAVAGNEQNTAGMRNAALTVMPDLTVTATAFWTCSVGSGHVSSSSACADGNLPMQWVEVDTSATLTPLLAFPGIPTQQDLHGLAVRRVARRP